MTELILDTHAHVWPRGLIHPAQSRVHALEAEPADLLGSMSSAGVEVAIVIPASVHPDDDYVIDAVADRPACFAAVAGLDVRDSSVIERIPVLADKGVVGMRANLLSGDPLTGPDLEVVDEIADAVDAAGLVLQWTVRLSGCSIVERVAARAPGLRQVVDHLGRPEDARDLAQLDRIRALAAAPMVAVKLSGLYALSRDGYPYQDTWDWVEGTVAAFGPDRTMWGSDWPLATESAPYPDQLEVVRLLPFLDDDARRWILGETARRFWWNRTDVVD